MYSDISMSQTHTYRFNLWGVYKWIPVAIRRICVKDETCCECKKCSDIQTYSQCVRTASGPDSMNRNTNKQTKDACDLADVDLRVFDPSTSTTLISFFPFQRNLSTCTCECPKKRCPPPLILDQQTCKYHCRRRLTCHRGYYFNTRTCRCEYLPRGGG